MLTVQAKDLLAIRDALVMSDVQEAYHILRMMADPDPEIGRDHWAEWERMAWLEAGSSPKALSVGDEIP